MDYTTLHPALPPISTLSLGSWNTYSRIPFDELCRLLNRAVELGINFFDVGYYWDNPHTEVLFGHAMRTLGIGRDDYLIAQKLWLWDYPTESFAEQVEKSLRRLGTDHVDVLMASRPVPGVTLADYLTEITDLINRGVARAWGLTNWEPAAVEEAYGLLEDLQLPLPVTVQLQYSIARRGVVEAPAYDDLFASRGLSLQPADTLEGGILAGKLDRDRMNPDDARPSQIPTSRNIARDSGNIRPRIRELFPAVREAAQTLGVTPAQFALAYALEHPHRSTVLVGASSAAQVEENARAVDVARRLGPRIVQLAREMDFGATGHPKLFSPSQPNSR